MKKLLLVTVAIFAFATVSAQGQFKAGVFGGLPIGDAGDLSTFTLGVDVSYLFEMSEDFDLGPAIGFSNSFLDDDFVGDDIQFLPIAAAGRYSVSDKFTLGADLGYAVGVNEGNDGGFYYSPRVQYGVSDAIDIVLAYRGVSADGGSFDVITLGIDFGL